jgi:hypothetical protein
MSWGISFVLSNKWVAWELIPGWKADGRDIGWAEMVAVKLALQVLIANNLSNSHIIIQIMLESSAPLKQEPQEVPLKISSYAR